VSGEAWRTLSLPARDEEVERLETTLQALGALAVTVEAMDDRPVFDLLDGSEPPLWSNCCVEALFPAEQETEGVIAALATAGFSTLGARQRLVADQDWQAAFRAHFPPLCFGRLWVVPSWREPPAEAEHILHLDPGMAFGTGTHPTTALCLAWLADFAWTPSTRVLDYGCGSGILAIAAAKLGAPQVAAVDIDPAACEVTRENALRNECADITIGLPSQLPAKDSETGRFDVIVANLLLQPILALRDEFAARLSTRGQLALSGLMLDQVPKVLAVYDEVFEMDEPRSNADWALLTGRLRR